jgi:hypothetical protein
VIIEPCHGRQATGQVVIGLLSTEIYEYNLMAQINWAGRQSEKCERIDQNSDRSFSVNFSTSVRHREHEFFCNLCFESKITKLSASICLEQVFDGRTNAI